MSTDERALRHLFVYGTLLSTEPQHSLLQPARYLGRARTANGFELYDLGEYPAALACAEGPALHGELYEVHPQRWPTLDEYEDERLFRRTTVALEDRRQAQMYVWIGPAPSAAQRITCGDWRRR